MARSCFGAAWCKPRGGYVINSLASGRRLALRIIRLQLAVAVLVGLFFLAFGRPEAVAATAGAALTAVGTALVAVRFFASISSPGVLLGRLMIGMVTKWAVLVLGLFLVLVKFKLPPLAAVAGLMAGLVVNLFALRFKG